MPQSQGNPGVLVATFIGLCAAPLVFAQTRVQEFPDSLTNDRVQTLQQQVTTLQQQVSALQQQLQQQAQVIGALQPQVQSLSQETDMLGVLMQNEKVNTANMVSMLESQLSSQWGQVINQRVGPLEQVLQISPSGVVVRSTGNITLEGSGEIVLAGASLRADVSTARFQRVLQSDTLITNTVIAATYTPGAGNIW